MPITVRVGFSGLCLFVPDPANGAGPRLHALLVNHGAAPAGDGDGHDDHDDHDDHDPNAHPPHFARLYVDRAYTRINSDEETGFPIGISLEGLSLTLGGGSRSITTTASMLGDDIIDLANISGVGTLPRKFVENAPGPQIAARISLTTGTPGQNAPASVWNVTAANGTKLAPVPIANEARWVIPNIDAASINLELCDLATGQLRETITLHPIANKLRFHVCCLPEAELPGAPPRPAPQPGDPADHFEAYFDLFPGVQAPKLTLKAHPMTSHTETCTSAQVQVGP